MPLEIGDYVCIGCGLTVDADARPSPRELERICDDCTEVTA